MAQRIVKPSAELLARIPEEHRPQENCEGCPFGGARCGSKGNPEAEIVIVSESPNGDDVRSGIPLSGNTGKAFHHFVPDDRSVYVLNAVECNPPRTRKTKERMEEAIGCCNNSLIDKIKAHPRRLIIAMGNAAVTALTGIRDPKITKIRGRLMHSDYAELGILPLVHLSALMMGTGSFRQWKEDIVYGMELGNGADPKIYEEPHLQVISDDATQEDIDFLFEQLLYKTNELTGDIETSGFNPREDRILSFGITSENDPSVSYCFWPHHIGMLQKFLEDKSISWAWHNGKFDVAFFHTLGIKARVDDDTMLLSYCLDETGGVHDLETVAADVLDAPDYKFMIQPYLPNKKTSYEVIPLDVLADYQKFDTVNTAQIRKIYRRRVRADAQLEKLYTQTLLPASKMLNWVQSNGIYVDQDRFDANDEYFDGEIQRLEKEINHEVGFKINSGSPQQISDLLFKKMKLPNYGKGSTSKDIIAKLREKHPHVVLDLLSDHRSAVKMHGTYVKGYRNAVESDGRIHSTFLLHGTKTGRLASRQPNIQNPPRLKRIRGTFIPAPGYELLEIDLSQAELRSLAAVSGDPLMVQVYVDDKDLHGDLAEQLFPGWAVREDAALKKEQRVKCKNVNFGIIYGITGFGLVDQMPGSTIRQCNNYIDGWYARYNVAADFIEMCRKAPKRGQDINTCFGRRKRHGLVARGNINFLMNEAANMPHQSIASDITLHTAIRTYEQLQRWDTKIVNLVHDALIMEVPISTNNEVRNNVIEYVSQEFEQVPIDWGITRVPFKTDAEIGDRWGSLVDIKELAA